MPNHLAFITFNNYNRDLL